MVPTDELAVYCVNNTRHGSVGDPIALPASQISRIRGRLGAHVIETVWATRVNSKGVKVIDRNRKALGYRWNGDDVTEEKKR